MMTSNISKKKKINKNFLALLTASCRAFAFLLSSSFAFATESPESNAQVLKAQAKFSEAVNFHGNKNYQAAMKGYKEASKLGHVEAMYRLADLYENYYKIVEDINVTKPGIEQRRLMDALAAFYLESAANLSHEGAAAKLEGRYRLTAVDEEEDEAGQTVSLDIKPEDALPVIFSKRGEFYIKKAKQANAIGKKRLLYAKAAHSYEEASALGHGPAYRQLGMMYYSGQGIDVSEQDGQYAAYLQARDYFDAASKRFDDAEAHFWVGFMLEYGLGRDGNQTEEDKAREQELHQAIAHYELASSHHHATAAYRLGLFWEEGRAIDISTPEKRKEAYERAIHYYALAKDHGYKEGDLTEKITILSNLKERADVLSHPNYGLCEHMFREYVHEHAIPKILVYAVGQTLKAYAQANDLGYTGQQQVGEKRIGDAIAELFAQGSSSRPIPDMSALDQKHLMLDTQYKGRVNHQGAAQMRLMQIKQYLKQEDEKWGDPEKTHPQKWLDETLPLLQGIQKLSSPFQANPLASHLQERLNALPLMGGTLSPEIQAIFPEADRALRDIHCQAEQVFKLVPQWQRTLHAQKEIYNHINILKKQTGLTLSEIMEDFLLMRALMPQDRKDDVSLLSKYFNSARGLRHYAQMKGLDIAEARNQLDQKAHEILSPLSLPLQNLGAIHLGYDALQRMMIEVAMRANLLQANQRLSQQWKQQHQAFLGDGTFNQEWFNRGSITARQISGQEQEDTTALLALYEKAKEIIAALDEERSQLASHSPRLNLLACSHEDPWIGLYGSVVDAHLAATRQKAAVIAQEVAIPLEEAHEGLLNEAVQAYKLKVSQLLPSLPHNSLNILGGIIGNMERSSSIQQRIDIKQKFLFMQDKIVNWETGTLEAKQVAVLGLLNGTAGRCPDGQSTFFNEWIANHMMNQTKDEGPSAQQALALRMSYLLQDYKRVFIAKHGNFFLHGSDDRQVHENRTAAEHLLTQMLRLPLNLTGSYNRVLYPGFVFSAGLKKEYHDHIAALPSVLERYFKGGSIVYINYRTVNENGRLVYQDQNEDRDPQKYECVHNWKSFTLKTFGHHLRESLYENNTIPSRHETCLPGLAMPRFQVGVPLDAVEAFIKHDPVLSPFYTAFMDSGHTQGNMFFDSEAAYVSGKSLRHTLRDGALLRLLDVAGYAHVPEGFYKQIESDYQTMESHHGQPRRKVWKFPEF